MGVSTDAILCYGVAFEEEEDYEFPWDGKDEEDWYMSDIMGFKHSQEIYSDEDPSGYVGGNRPSQEVIDAYYKEYADFKNRHPMPFEVVTHCSDEYPMYILAVPGTVKRVSRGYPSVIEPSLLQKTENECLWVEMIDFLKEHGVEVKQPQWLLASYWG